MRFRRKLNKGKSRRMFSKHARKVHKKNTRKVMFRGGTRL